MVVDYFKVSEHVVGGTEEIYRNSQRKSVPVLKIETGISIILRKIDKKSTTTRSDELLKLETLELLLQISRPFY
jgi:hypothetical protein